MPLALFGPEIYSAVMGRPARPAQVAEALAPMAEASVIAHAGATVTFLVLAAIAIAVVGLVLLLQENIGDERQPLA